MIACFSGNLKCASVLLKHQLSGHACRCIRSGKSLSETFPRPRYLYVPIHLYKLVSHARMSSSVVKGNSDLVLGKLAAVWATGTLKKLFTWNLSRKWLRFLHGARLIATPVLLPCLFIFTFPFSFKNYQEARKKEVMKNIPAELFKQEKIVRKRKISYFRKLMRYLASAWRMAYIVIMFTPVILLYPFTYLSHYALRAWWRLILGVLEHLGPMYIKLGQWASTRRDIFSDEFCELFSRLHDHTSMHAWEFTKLRLKQAFGKKWKSLFIKIEKEPIGSGCIGQVHKGWMRGELILDESIVEDAFEADVEADDELDFAEGIEITSLLKTDDDDDPDFFENSEVAEVLPAEVEKAAKSSIVVPVAIKIVHPNIEFMFDRDLRILRTLAWVAEKTLPSLRWLSLMEAAVEFADLLARQIDLRFEANCLDQFNENFEGNTNIAFPRPIHPFCRKHVLVETFEEGIRLSKFIDDRVMTPEGLNHDVASHCVNALLQMIFSDDLIHGDMHPGNILVQNAHLFSAEDKMVLTDLGDTVIVNVRPADSHTKLILLDAGISSSLNEEDFQNFKNIFTAVVMGDGDTVADLVFLHSQHSLCRNVTDFKSEISQHVKDYRQKSLQLGSVQMTDLLREMFATMYYHRVKLKSNFATVMLAIFVSEGLGRSLDPDLDLLEYAKPILLNS